MEERLECASRIYEQYDMIEDCIGKIHAKRPPPWAARFVCLWETAFHTAPQKMTGMHRCSPTAFLNRRLVCTQTGEDMGRVVRVHRRVSGKHKGKLQGLVTDRIMEVAHHPRWFVAFFNVRRDRLESKFVHGTFGVV